ncbi:MAG: hypothetical protein V9E83_06500 [Baekduia sp.]
MSDQEQTPADAAEPRACTVCRGTGTVLSNLGGSLSEQQCPWCEGSRVFLPEHDAQAARSGA